jgi:hypothetical protein
MFEDTMGRNQMALCDDPLTRRGIELWLERVLGVYGEDGGVDIEVIDDQLILNEKTVDYIYGDFTPEDLPYVTGSRPTLEAIVNEYVTEGISDRDKALVLMRRVRDNQDRGLARPGLFNGGDEEELLKRGAIMCNEVSRLYACLVQIAGLPARLFCSHISGHMMNEVLIDGKWAWVDSHEGPDARQRSRRTRQCMGALPGPDTVRASTPDLLGRLPSSGQAVWHRTAGPPKSGVRDGEEPRLLLPSAGSNRRWKLLCLG